MESTTSEIAKRAKGTVSPYSMDVNIHKKEIQMEILRNKAYFIWLAPAFLTITEIIYLKHSKVALANKISIFKWTSYILAVCATNFASHEALRRCEYFNRVYPRPSKLQVESLSDKIIYSKLNDDKLAKKLKNLNIAH